MTNVRQQELIDHLVNQIRKKFPEVQFIDVTESPEDPRDLWVNVTEPEDEDKQIELGEFAGELESDILDTHGYLIMIMPTRNHGNSQKSDNL